MLNVAPNTRLFQAPKRLEPVGKLAWAELTPIGPFGPQSNGAAFTPAQRAGLLYEEKAQRHFSRRYPLNFGGGQWITFRELNSPRVRWAQPDGLLIDWRRGLLIIIEMKIRHMESAWWSLRYLYEPLFAFLFPSWSIASCEVCRWFDPAIKWPEVYRRLPDPLALKPNEIGVHIWAG